MTEFRTGEHLRYQSSISARPLLWNRKGSKATATWDDEPRYRWHWIVEEPKVSTKFPGSFLFNRRLSQEIDRARTAILALQYNWDGQGSPGYVESTLDRAISILNAHVKHVFENSRRILIPKILPSDDASIDIHWREQKFELLVNVPASDDIVVSFYGENLLDRSFIKGAFAHSSTSKFLANWLTEVSE